MQLALLLFALQSSLLAAVTPAAGGAPPAASPMPAERSVAATSLAPATEAPASDPAPAPVVGEEITVTATGVPTRLGETASAVTVLDGEELATTPALVLDDALRQTPGFTLFRRSGSRSANPTTQGASLRGLGGSAGSRALVLADALPLNDPFGGWVAWGRVPRLALARAEVLRGGASDLYGSGALGGVVQLVRQPVAPATLRAEASGGNQSTAAAALFASDRRGDWGAALAAERMTTAGYVLVPPEERGTVDTPAGGAHDALEATLERSPEGAARLFLRGSRFDERRTNGTPLQWNTTALTQLAAGADGALAGGDATLRAWGTREDYRQTFSAVAADRDSERLVRDQTVPSDELGLLGRFTRALGARQTLLLGADARRTRGESDEISYAGPQPVATAAGGVQEGGGLFVEDLVALGARVSLAAGVRADGWRNRAGPGGSAERSATQLSPRLALRWQLAPDWSLAASAYRAFRAPTLNELYRGFRLGDVITQPNPLLRPERLRGAELGLGWQPSLVRGAPRLRATLFSMELDDAIANVTVGSAAGATVRRRENLARTRSQGVELEGETALGGGFALDGSLVWDRARVAAYPADPTLVGLQVAQVPERAGSLRLAWSGRRAGAVLAVRHGGAAYEDDRNTLLLDPYTVVDLEASHRLRAGAALFLAVENLLDARYPVGLTPVTTEGAPRLVRVGVRLGG